MPRAIITLVLLLVSLGAARADLRIVSSAGGEVGPYLQFFRGGPPIWRAGNHRRALPIGLHAGAEHDPAGPYLCHAAGRPRLPCCALDRSAGQAICGARRDAHRHRGLSGRSARLDQAQRRPDAKTNLAARAPACGALSALPVAPFRLQSSLNPPNKSDSEANGGQIVARHISAALAGLLADVLSQDQKCVIFLSGLGVCSNDRQAAAIHRSST